MKVRKMRMAACLLAGATLMTSITAYAVEPGKTEVMQSAGFSLALADVDLEEKDALQADVEAAAQAQAEAEAAFYAGLGVAQVNDYVNIRSEASVDSEIVGRLENNGVATVNGIENGWYQITSGSVSGYIQEDYLVVGDADLIKSVELYVAEVQTDSLKLRSDASTEASVMGITNTGDCLSVLDETTEGWVKVSASQGEGYLSSDYVVLKNTYKYAKTQEEVSGGSAAAQYGLQFVGNPYRWGGSSLTNGTDCSGFIMSVYAHYGVSLPHSSAALRGVGTGVDYADAKPGDIICYSGHVALYIGNGQVVHAANERKGIIVSSATHKKILAVRRIFQ